MTAGLSFGSHHLPVAQCDSLILAQYKKLERKAFHQLGPSNDYVQQRWR